MCRGTQAVCGAIHQSKPGRLLHASWFSKKQSQPPYTLGNLRILKMVIWKGTPPKFKIAPANGWLEDDPFLLGHGLFSGAKCHYVSFRTGI